MASDTGVEMPTNKSGMRIKMIELGIAFLVFLFSSGTFFWLGYKAAIKKISINVNMPDHVTGAAFTNAMAQQEQHLAELAKKTQDSFEVFKNEISLIKKDLPVKQVRKLKVVSKK